MQAAYFALVILFSGGTDGGRAISIVNFSNGPACEIAAERVAKSVRQGNAFAGLTAICIDVR